MGGRSSTYHDHHIATQCVGLLSTATGALGDPAGELSDLEGLVIDHVLNQAVPRRGAGGGWMRVREEG